MPSSPTQPPSILKTISTSSSGSSSACSSSVFSRITEAATTTTTSWEQQQQQQQPQQSNNCRPRPDAHAKTLAELTQVLLSDDKRVVKDAFDALFELNLADDEAAHLRFIMAGGCFLVVQSMRNNRGAHVIQNLGAYLIALLTYENDQNRVAFSDVGAVDAIVKGMKEHPAHDQLQFNGIGALSNLSLYQPCQNSILQFGGLEMMLNFLRGKKQRLPMVQWIDILKANPIVVKLACDSLCVLAQDNEQGKQSIWDSRGLTIVAQLLELWPDDVELRETGLQFMNIMLAPS